MVVAFLTLGAGTVLAAEAFPTRPIQVVVIYPAGGGNDLHCRALASVATEYIEQPMVAVIKAGGGGAVGTDFVAKARADGHTLACVDNGALVLMPQVQKVPYSRADFVPIGLINRIPFVLTVRGDAPWKSVAELVEDAKRNPGKLNAAIVGLMSSDHYAMALFADRAGVKFNYVTYGGGGPKVKAMLTGESKLDMLFPALIVPHLKAGTMRPLAVAAAKRVPELPELPTFKEVGLDVEAYIWIALYAPKATPADRVEKLRRAVEKIVTQDRSFKAIMERMGQSVDFMTGEQLAKFEEEEVQKSAQVIKGLAQK
jgi:tripartite-type tricarboxylate transporter receptor subunit TctC